jgi:hypothetical protein
LAISARRRVHIIKFSARYSDFGNLRTEKPAE